MTLFLCGLGFKFRYLLRSIDFFTVTLVGSVLIKSVWFAITFFELVHGCVKVRKKLLRADRDLCSKHVSVNRCQAYSYHHCRFFYILAIIGLPDFAYL